MVAMKYECRGVLVTPSARRDRGVVSMREIDHNTLSPFAAHKTPAIFARTAGVA